MGKLRIEYKPLDEILPAPVNPKRHDVEEIKASMRRFGVIEAAVEDGRTGRLVGGHGRTEAMIQLRDLQAAAEEAGVAPPEGVDVVDGRWLVPISVGWSSRDDEEAEAVVIALNSIGPRGGWDDAVLAAMLERQREGPGLEGVGYTPAQLDELIAGQASIPVVPPPEFPEVGDDLETEHQCPRCGYEWSGQSKPAQYEQEAALEGAG